VLYWKGIQKRCAHGQISTTVLKWWAKSGEIQWNSNHLLLSKQNITKNINSVYQDLKQIKEQANRWDTWLGQMISAQAAAQNIPKKWLWQWIQLMETIRHKAKLVQGALKPDTRCTGLLSVTPPLARDKLHQMEVNTNQNLKTNVSKKHTGTLCKQLTHLFCNHHYCNF